MTVLDQVPGSGDCEARIEGLGQPALLMSSAAYVVAALVVLWWTYRHTSARAPVATPLWWLFAAGLVTAGLGSMDYHGPAWGPQPLVHDTGLAIPLVAALAIDLAQLRSPRHVRTWGLAAVTVLAVAVIAVVPAVSPLLAGVAAVALVAAEIAVYRRGLRRLAGPAYAGLGCLAVGALLFALSRTGGPLCTPSSLLQGHAAWHVLTAAALTLWAVTALPDRKETA